MDRMNRMLGRMAPRPKSSKGPIAPVHTISGPVLVESTIDHDVLQNMMDISSQQPDSPYRREQRADHFGTNYGHGAEAFPTLQTSLASTYTQPRSSTLQTKRRPVASSHYDDVSPPDSPRTLEVQSPTSGDVSPIDRTANDDVHPAFRSKARVASQIPVAKRVAANEVTLKSRAYKRDPSAPLKWDKYTGEPTTSKQGLPSGVKPIHVVKGLEQTRARPSPVEDSVVEDVVMADSRPPWKGASGRSAIVQAVRTKANPAPFNAAGLLTPPQSMSPTDDRNDVFTSAKMELGPDRGDRQISVETNYPMVANVTPQSVNTKIIATPTGYPSPPLAQEDIIATPPTSQGNDMAMDTSPSSTRTVRTNNRSRGQSKPGVPNPNSRFSWTTLNTNTTYQHSPPPSPPPALPSNANSIMNRMRPVKSSRNYSPNSGSPIIPDAPPFASYRSVSGKYSRPISSDSDEYPTRSSSVGHEKSYAPSLASTTFGGSKALPPTPQELQSRDHISQLEAQLADLRLQRSNIERVLRDMTRPTATHALTTNFLVEREREKRVGALKDELHSIGMLEHALGLQLHRANRRKERVEGYEGFTTLWVRRATGLSYDP